MEKYRILSFKYDKVEIYLKSKNRSLWTYLFGKSNHIIFCFLFYVPITTLNAQFGRIQLENEAHATDIGMHPTGMYFLGNSNHDGSSRSDIIIGHSNWNVTDINPNIRSLFNTTQNFTSGKIALGPIEFLDVPIVSHYSITASASSISDAIARRSVIANIDNLTTASEPEIRWVKKSTNFNSIGEPLVVYLEGDNYIFIYSYFFNTTTIRTAIAKFNAVGVVQWEKTYDLQRDHGTEYNVLCANAAIKLVSNNIAIGGYIALNTSSSKIPFLFVIDTDGRLKCAKNYSRSVLNNNSEITGLVQAKSGANEIYFVGNEKSETEERIIHIGKVNEEGVLMYHKFKKFLNTIPNSTNRISAHSISMEENEQRICIMGTTRTQIAIDANFFLRFNTVTGLFDHFNLLSTGFSNKITIEKDISTEPRFIALRGFKDIDIGLIYIQRINLLGAIPECHDFSWPHELNTQSLVISESKRVKSRNFSNLENFSLTSTYTAHPVIYCPSATSLKGEIIKKGESFGSQKASLNSWAIYPNPAFNEIFISNIPTGIKSFNIYDLNGRLVKNISKNLLNEKSLRIPIQDLNSGSYFISILSDQGTTVKKLIVR